MSEYVPVVWTDHVSCEVKGALINKERLDQMQTQYRLTKSARAFDSPPSDAVDGDWFFNVTDSRLYIFKNGKWEKVSLSSEMTAHTGDPVIHVTQQDKTKWDGHVANTANPHAVTKAQIGLGNVDNTSDANKTISTAVQNALDSKLSTSQIVQTIGQSVTGVMSQKAVTDALTQHAADDMRHITTTDRTKLDNVVVYDSEGNVVLRDRTILKVITGGVSEDIAKAVMKSYPAGSRLTNTNQPSNSVTGMALNNKIWVRSNIVSDRGPLAYIGLNKDSDGKFLGIMGDAKDNSFFIVLRSPDMSFSNTSIVISTGSTNITPDPNYELYPGTHSIFFYDSGLLVFLTLYVSDISGQAMPAGAVMNLGSSGLELNLSTDGSRPTVNGSEGVAYVSDIDKKINAAVNGILGGSF